MILVWLPLILIIAMIVMLLSIPFLDLGVCNSSSGWWLRAAAYNTVMARHLLDEGAITEAET